VDLLIIRHGEPDLTGDDLSDLPLTDLGQRQAVATAHHLSTTALDAVYFVAATIAEHQLVIVGARAGVHKFCVTPLATRDPVCDQSANDPPTSPPLA